MSLPVSDKNTYLVLFLRGLTQIVHKKYLEEYLAKCRFSKTVVFFKEEQELKEQAGKASWSEKPKSRGRTMTPGQ